MRYICKAEELNMCIIFLFCRRKNTDLYLNWPTNDPDSLFYVIFVENAIEIFEIQYNIPWRLKYSGVSGNGANQSEVNKQDRDLEFWLFVWMYTSFMLMALYI